MCLQFSVANLFKILCTKLYQNWPSFVEDYDKTFWPTFFWDTVHIILQWLFMVPLLGNLWQVLFYWFKK